MTPELFAFLCTAMIAVCHCRADHRLPAPKNLSYVWLDRFTVYMNWTWERPRNLPKNCTVQYGVLQVDRSTDKVPDLKKVKNLFHIQTNLLTEDMRSGRWDVSVLGDPPCAGWSDSDSESITITTPKPAAEVVKNFRCFIESEELNCFWSPVNPTQDLTVYYRYSASANEDNKHSKKCDQGTRNSCRLKFDRRRELFVLVETAAALESFRPKLVIHPPELNITEDGDYLNLSWTRPDIRSNCEWEYTVCYEKCYKAQGCPIFKPTETSEPMRIAYDKNCEYKFEYNVKTDEYCIPVSSDRTVNRTFGENKPPDRTLTVVAIVVPVILSMCVILSCYCFRRHSAIICPIIPDPSAMLKDIMMNGNKDLKPTTGRLYTPVPEPIEPCKITLVAEGSEQNSDACLQQDLYSGQHLQSNSSAD